MTKSPATTARLRRPSAPGIDGTLLGILFLLATTLGATGCQDTDEIAPPRASASTPREGGVFQITQSAPSSLDPAKMNDSYEAAVINQLYDGLLTTDTNFNILPAIAESWHISRDGLTYTFRLKHGVRFHDGSEVQSDDVVFSLSRIFRLPEDETYLAREYLSHVEGVEEYAKGRTDEVRGLDALGPYTVRIQLAHSAASFLAVLASEPTRIVPREYVEEGPPGVLDRSPVGCGPFRLKEWKAGERLVLERFEDYHAARAHLDRVVFVTPPDSVKQRAVESFLVGADDALELTSGRLSEIASVPDVQIHRRQELSLTFLGFNVQKPPFDDVRLRRAFAQAVDLDALESLREGGRVRPNGMLPPGFPGYTPDPKMPAHDPDHARRLLEVAGHPDGEGLPTIVHAIADPSDSDLALFRGIERQVERVGFEMELETGSWDSFDARLRSGSFSTFSVTWVADIPDPDSFFYPLFHSQGSVNYMRYHSAAVDTLLTAGRRGATEGPRIEAYREVERLLLRDLPVVPINHSLAVLAVRENVRDFSMSPLGVGNLPLEHVWMDATTFGEAAR